MPRGVKGSGKQKMTKAVKVTADVATEQAANALAAYTPVEAVPVEKPRKSYPLPEERIAMADKQIERLTALRSSREALVAKTESLLSERQKALASCATALEKAEAKKARLIALKDKPVKEPAEKLSPEERKARRASSLVKARAAKKAEKEKYDAVVAAIQASGKTLDEFIAEMNAE